MTMPVQQHTPGSRDVFVRGVMALMFMLCAALWLWGGGDAVSDRAAPSLPTPWGPGRTRCPAGGDEPVRVRALAREAETIWQRAFFDWSDAPRAIERLSKALACARSCGDLHAVDRYSARVAAWKQHVQHLQDREALRLELAERQRESRAVQLHAERLQALLREGDPQRVGEARAWLSRVTRRARARRALVQKREHDDE